MTGNDPILRGIAFREAGYVVAYINNGIEIPNTEILPSSPFVGSIPREKLLANFMRYYESASSADMTLRKELETEIVPAYAGELAKSNALRMPLSNVLCGSVEEHAFATRQCFRLFMDQSVAEAYMHFLREWARSIIFDDWSAVVAIADTLIVERLVTRQRLCNIYGREARK